MESKHILHLILPVLLLMHAAGASTAVYQAAAPQSYGYAIFNGSSYVNTQAGGMPKDAAARSVFAWVYPKEFSGTIYSYGLLGNNELSSFYINGNGTLSFQAISNGAASSFKLKTNTWNFVGYSYIANSTNMTFYYGGSSQTVALSANEPLQTSAYAQSFIGKEANCNGPCSNFVGFMSDLRVYTVAFNSSNANSLYMGGPGVGRKALTNNLVAWWQMNGTVLDYSGSGNSGSYHYISYGSFNKSKTFGVISGEGGSVYQSTPGGVYDYGSVITISAMAIPGYAFANWSCTGIGCYSGGAPNSTVTIKDNITETANFYKPSYLLSLAASPQSGGRIAIAANAGQYSIKAQEAREAYGTVVRFSEAPDAGYTFVNWSCTGNGCYSGSASSPEITVYDNITETANFANKPVNISVSVYPEAGGRVFGGGIYATGHNASIAASPNRGYMFANWSCTGIGCYSGKIQNFTLSTYANITETANFAPANSASENNKFPKENIYTVLYYLLGAIVIIVAFVAAYRELVAQRTKKKPESKEHNKIAGESKNGK